MPEDPWAAAQKTQPAPEQNGGSSLSGSYGNKPSRLFASSGDGPGPALFNKTHAVGTERTGIIAKAPYDHHSTTVAGEQKYWQTGQKKPVTTPTGPNGEANRPVWDTVIVLDTEYVMDAAEAAAINRQEPYEGGRRSYTISSGEDLKKFQEAIADAVKRGVSLTDDDSMVGKRLTVKRTGTRPNPQGGDPIKVHEFRIDAA